MAWSAPEKDEFRRRWEAGETVSTIAHALGKHPSSVKYHRKAMGLPERPASNLERKVKVGLDDTTFRLFRAKARRDGMTLAERLRRLVAQDLSQP